MTLARLQYAAAILAIQENTLKQMPPNSSVSFKFHSASSPLRHPQVQKNPVMIYNHRSQQPGNANPYPYLRLR